MLNEKTTNKCTECGKKAKHTIYGKYYCKKHYILEMFGCSNIHDYLNKKKIYHMHNVIDGHIILRKRNENLIEMCDLLEVEYWFGKEQDEKLSDYMHIDSGKEEVK